MSILSNAVSGLNAYQRALATVSNNIANVNTEGYTRQVVELSTSAPELTGGSYDGKGVYVSNISRVYDQYLYDRVISRTSTFAQTDTFLQSTKELDATFGEPSTSMAGPLQSFFNAVQDVASNPTSLPARQVVLSEGATLVDRFQALDQQLNNMNLTVNGQLSVAVTEINNISTSIKNLNIEITSAVGASGGTGLPNDLLDERDRLILKLAEFTQVKTTVQGDQSMNVYIGTGQALVLGGDANRLKIINDNFDSSDRQIALVTGGQSASITNELSGGLIGGLYDLKKEIIEPSQNALGRLALSISSAMNTLNQGGSDINGNAGGLFFNDVVASSPQVLPASTNNSASGTVSVAITSVPALEVSDYQLSYDGTNFSLARMSDNTIVDSNFSVSDLPRAVASEGFSISLSGSVSSGDAFIIRPTRGAAGSIQMALTNTEGFAAAASGAAAGNNTNALAMAALQSTQTIGNNSLTYQEAFSTIISVVAAKTNQAASSNSAQRVLLNQALEAHSSVSGVNLDEEAASLLKYQQAYQASARMIAAADEIFQSLLDAVR